MNHFSLLQKLAPLGVAAIGAIAATGIATAPAQASQLGWSNGTTEFLDQLFPIDGRPTGNFEVTFSPDRIAGIAGITGQFLPPFAPDVAPPQFQYENLTPAFGSFEDSGQFAPGFSLYSLKENLVFDFNNGVVVTYAKDSEFVGEYDFDNSGDIEGVEFELEIAKEGTNVTVNGQPYYLSDDPDFNSLFPLTGITLTFDEPSEGEFGEYSAGVTKGGTVPEPASVLGLLTFAGLGLRMKRKQQA